MLCDLKRRLPLVRSRIVPLYLPMLHLTLGSLELALVFKMERTPTICVL